MGGFWVLPVRAFIGLCFRSPVVGPGDWAAGALGKGPELSICSLAGRHLTSEVFRLCGVPWRPGREGQGEEPGCGSGSLPTRVTWATGHAWGSDSVELLDVTLDHNGMSLSVLHHDS